MLKDDDPKNWQEDFSHENGNYYNRCYICNQLFLGHKRRVVCRVCQPPLNKEVQDERKRDCKT